jgi:hypothetical protein
MVFMHLKFDGPVFSGWYSSLHLVQPVPMPSPDSTYVCSCVPARLPRSSNAWEKSAAIPLMARRPNTRARWTCDKEDYEVMQLTASVLLMMGARTCGSETAAGARACARV